MKSRATAFWCVLSILLATALVIQWNYNKKQRLTLEKLQLQVEKNSSGPSHDAAVKELEKEKHKLVGELRAAEFELNSARLNAAAMQAHPAANAPGPIPPAGEAGQGKAAAPANMGKMLGTMLKDPEMRKAMEQQQRMGIEMIYASMFKKLQLTPEQEKKMKDLLLAQQMENMSQAGAMFDQSGDRGKVAQELAEKRQASEAQIKEIIGDDKFAQYQDYNQTLGERMMLEQFARGAEISPEQNEQLLTIMREEKQNVQANFGAPQVDPNKDWQSLLGSKETTSRFFAQQREVNERVLDRARQLLTPEQIDKLTPALENQLKMQEAAIRMAGQMLGNGAPGEAASEPAKVSNGAQP